MGLGERLLQKMKKDHRIFFACFIGLSLLINIPSEFYFTSRYEMNYIHITLAVAIVFLIFNPPGIRLLMMLLFAYLLFSLLKPQSYPGMVRFDRNATIYGFPLHKVGVSMILIKYIHIGLYLVSIGFAFIKPTSRKQKVDPELIDDFN